MKQKQLPQINPEKLIWKRNDHFYVDTTMTACVQILNSLYGEPVEVTMDNPDIYSYELDFCVRHKRISPPVWLIGKIKQHKDGALDIYLVSGVDPAIRLILYVWAVMFSLPLLLIFVYPEIICWGVMGILWLLGVYGTEKTYRDYLANLIKRSLQ